MRRFLFGLVCLASAAGLFSCTVFAQANSERRIALVIGNGAYQAGALNTAANDAGLIAQTLQAAGFDVVGARDLDQDSLRRAMRDFLDKAQEAGRDTVAFIYLAGYGLQLEGDNYFVPIDARIARDIDVAAEAVRISDYTRPLVALGLKQTIVVLDAARANPFARSGQPLAGGLALIEPEQGMLIAFNAAPGTVGQEGQGPYGAYAQALAEMMREGGLPLAEVFDRVRLRVNDVTQGGEVPWHAVRGDTDFVFFERGPDAPPPQASLEQTQAIRTRPIRDLDAQDAYIAALERDTLDGYLDFVAVYPDEPMAKRVRAIIAARREAITWRRTRIADTPEAYWSYLRRYPNGPHAWDARRRLAYLAAAMEPPPSFAMIEYDVPPPLEDEIVYIGRPAIAFYDPVYAFAPPPPPPVYYLPPPPPDFIALPPPPPPVSLFALPIPMYRPIPAYVRPPRYVAPPPPNNVIYNNIHNTVIINNRTNTVSITDRRGQTRTLQPPAPPPPPSARRPGGAVTAAPAAPAIGPALPPSVARRASQGQTPARVPGAQPGALPGVQPAGPGPSRVPGAPGRPLPGAGGQPLPPAPGVATPPPATTPQRGRPPASATLPGTPPPGSPGRRLPPPGAATPGTTPSATTSPRRTTLPAGPQRPAPGTQPPAAVTSPASPPAASDTRRRSGPPSSVQPGRTAPPPALDRRGPPPSAAVPAPARPVPPAMERRGPPPASAATPPAARPAPPPPAMRQAPPPPAVRAAPPPPAARAAPPPPAVRTAPPPAAIRAAPPPAAAVRPAPPPPAARAAPPAGRPKCPVVNGKEVCPGR